MALAGNIVTNFGVAATYHNIGFFTWDKNGKLTVLVQSFLDQTARQNNADPIATYNLSFSNVLTNDQLSLTDLYGLIKTDTLFATMTNC